MMKKSRMVAVLAVCVMMFGVVQPACAWDWRGSFLGGIGGVVVGGALVIVTGGAALPIIAGSTMVVASLGGADEDPKSSAVAGVGGGLGATIVYETVKTGAKVLSPVPLPLP